MISLGYEKGSKAYKFMRNNTIFISDNAIFDENNFPRRNKTSSSKLIESPPGITTNSKWDKTIGHNDNSKTNNSTLIVKMKDPHTIITIKIVILHMMMIDVIHCMMTMVMKRKRWNLW